YAGHVWVEPTPLLDEPDIFRLAAYSFVLAVFSATLEELVFRGAMQPLAVRLFGGYGVLYTSLVFALLYIGSRSPEGVALAFAAGGLFGLARLRTGQLWGAIAAHTLMTAGMLVVFPAYF
ncbi:MAG: lysostaphin resistance A-like protein, partial [Geminicoccales bacterium]